MGQAREISSRGEAKHSKALDAIGMERSAWVASRRDRAV